MGSSLNGGMESAEICKFQEVYISKRREVVDVERGLEKIIDGELKIPGVKARIFSNYVAEGMSQKDFKKGIPTVFAELPVDTVFSKEEFVTFTSGKSVLRIESKPGQYDQRVDSMTQCFKTFGVEDPKVRYIRTVVLEREGKALSSDEMKKIEHYLCNPVEEASLQEKDKYVTHKLQKSPSWYEVVGGFRSMSPEGLVQMAEAKGIFLQVDDLQFIQRHYAEVLKRDPSVVELKVLMTYWSDHCRHTTFHTKLKDIVIEGDEGMKADIVATLEKLKDARTKLGKGEEDLTFMNIVTTPPKYLKKMGIKNLQKLDESDEINAFTYRTTITLENGETEEYLVMFKNETHNSPTQAAPFGGAATCIGGAIRDNLSARGYTFYAMRVSGSADPTEPLDAKTIGELSQKFLSQFSALGHASYGNQIGIANAMVREYFNPGYRAKHMEVGYVIAYAPQNAVVHEKPESGDMVIQFGGFVGRDGVAGAAVSSSGAGSHSADVVGSHVQKGDAVIEGAIQSLMLDTEFTRLMKRCNDFGAGGISVAAGEIAPGLDIWLDKQKTKYEGMNEYELAIAESQERMCMVIEPKDWEEAQKIARKYNLELSHVGEVTNGEEGKGQLRMLYRGNAVVDISREFIDSAGSPKTQERVLIEAKSGKAIFESFGEEIEDDVERFLTNLKRKEVALQKGLGSIFDDSVGAGTVLAPYGGKYQLSPQIAGVALLPTYNRTIDGIDTNLHGLMSRTAVANAIGFALSLSDKNVYLASQFSIIEFVSKMVAVGVKKDDIYYGLQEYFEGLGKEDARWGKVTAMLLGAVRAMFELELAAIGGKDSASGHAKTPDGRVDVPPTLIPMGNGTLDRERVRSAELQKVGNNVFVFRIPKDENGLPDWEGYKKVLSEVESLHDRGLVVSASVVEHGGLTATISKMAIGNRIGFSFLQDVDKNSLYTDAFGDIVVEVANDTNVDTGELLGTTIESPEIILGGAKISLKSVQESLLGTLEGVYSTAFSGGEVEPITEYVAIEAERILHVNISKTQPKVLVPVFPGTNSHRDTAQALRRAGFTNIEIFYFRNTSPDALLESVRYFAQALQGANVTVFSGGFGAGDEPDGSAKYMAMLMRMNEVKDILQEFLDTPDTLTLGICNGFQLLMKLGVFSGERPIVNEYLKEGDMTLAHNVNLRHITDKVGLILTSNKGPWFSKIQVGDTFVIPTSHGEGRILASQEQVLDLIKNGQVVLQYLDEEGKPTNKYNGSVAGIAGLVSPDGRVLGLMPHPERAYEFLWKNIPGNHFLDIFGGAADAFGVKPKYVKNDVGVYVPHS